LCAYRYKDGAATATFSGVRTFERISEFIDEHTLATKPSQDKEPAAEIPIPPQVKTTTGRKLMNEEGEVLVLDAESFADVVQGEIRGPTFVKFYAPW
jgi:hypothetical protein